MPREPGYRLHKPTGQAYVRLGGKMFYLGPFGTDESREKYARLKAEWLTGKHAAKFQPQPATPTMATVCNAFLDHAEGYYSPEELDRLKMAIRPVAELYATLEAADFGPAEYRAVRQWWLDRSIKTRRGRCTRSTINQQMNRLRRVVKWAVGQGMIPPSVDQAIRCVDPLKRGRCAAPEAKPIEPVAVEAVEATLPHLPPIVADMVRLQLLTGARPGEVCKLTPRMVDRSTGEVWTIRLDDHKTAHHGHERYLYAGPKAQAVLLPYLLRGDDDRLFRPVDTLAKQREARSAARVTPEHHGNRPGTNRVKKPKRSPREAYTTHSYRKAIERAASKAGVANWSPNQLRHARATEVRRLFGLEAASSVLGHSNLQTTQVYAEQDRQRAVAVAKAIG